MEILMRKALIALGVLIVGLFIAFITLYQQPTYAGVSMPKSDYRQLKTSKQNISQLLDDLDHFDYTKPTTMAAVEKTGTKIIKHNSKNLSASDAKAMRETLYGRNGIISITKNAQKGKYNIDASVASRFHDKFEVLIELSVNAINKSSAQRQRIVDKLNSELNIESSIYHIGIQDENEN